MTIEKFVPKPDSFEKIEYTRKLIVRGDYEIGIPTVVDQIFGSGASQWFKSESDERLAKERQIAEHDTVLKIKKLLEDKYGNDI